MCIRDRLNVSGCRTRRHCAARRNHCLRIDVRVDAAENNRTRPLAFSADDSAETRISSHSTDQTGADRGCLIAILGRVGYCMIIPRLVRNRQGVDISGAQADTGKVYRVTLMQTGR